MRLLVKLGGTLLDDPASRARIASELAQADAGNGIEMVVVHGGGKQMTRFLAERGVESKFVNGLRVTSPEILDAVLKVFAGTVNHELVATLVAAGSRAVGLSGIDASLTEAVQLDPELGAVGKPVRADARLLETLTGAGFLPVVACVAGDRQGNIYNVNADQMASACAAAFRVDRLIFLTDVEGVLDREKQVLSVLNSEGIRGLIAAGVATGGMQAKLDAAAGALAGGVGQVTIAAGTRPGVLQSLLEGASIGTRIVC